MRKITIKSAIFGMILLPALAAAQLSDSYSFLKAVKERDGVEATKYVSKPGSVIIDTHDNSTGETALHIVTKDRDTQWLHFLLAKGAQPDARDRDGETPLLIATRLDFEDGVDLLLAYHAGIDVANAKGETPLIRAVQINALSLVKTLLAQGANADKADHIAGLSAHDYAMRATRNPALIKAFDDVKGPARKPKQGPSL